MLVRVRGRSTLSLTLELHQQETEKNGGGDGVGFKDCLIAGRLWFDTGQVYARIPSSQILGVIRGAGPSGVRRDGSNRFCENLIRGWELGRPEVRERVWCV